jgi:Lrp/AsnC family transcriptional regulator, leucine-responsive regulatory protein
VQGVEPDQQQPGRADQREQDPPRPPARPGPPGLAGAPGRPARVQAAHHLGRPGQVGVGRAQGQHQRGDGGGGPAGRADGQLEQESQRYIGPAAAAQAGDGRHGQAKVERGRDGERDRGHPRQLPVGPGEPGRERGDGLPAGERQHQGGRRPADRRPAVRGERRPAGRAGRRRGSGHGHNDHHDQQRHQRKLSGRAGPDPAEGQDEHRQQQRARHRGPHQLGAAGQVGHVAGADEADDRGAAHHAGQEAPPGRGPGPAAEPSRRVARDAAAGRPGAAQRGEHRGQQGGEPDERDPGDDRRRAGLGGGQARQEQQARAEQRTDVQRRAARDGQRAERGSSWCRHGSSLAEAGSHAMANIARPATSGATLCVNLRRSIIFMPDFTADRIDRAIVATLQRDGRMANVDLAEAVSLSPSACLRRVKALEASGIIAGYRAEVDRATAGLGLTVFVGLRVERHSRQASVQIEQALLAIPAVVACYLITGTADFMVEVAVPDLPSYERMLLDQVLAIPGVVEARSTFTIRTIRSRGPLPLDHWR